MEPFYLNPGEEILWVRPTDDGGYVVRIRFPNGAEDVMDVYPGQEAPDVEQFLAECN